MMSYFSCKGKHVITKAEVSLEAGHRRYTAVCLSEICLSPPAYSALIFTQTLVKDKSDRRLH